MMWTVSMCTTWREEYSNEWQKDQYENAAEDHDDIDKEDDDDDDDDGVDVDDDNDDDDGDDALRHPSRRYLQFLCCPVC